MVTTPALALAVLAPTLAPAPQEGACDAEWTLAFGGVEGGLNHAPIAVCTFDDGTGPALYAAGAFTAAGGEPIPHVAKWTGTAWAALGLGLGRGVWEGVYDLAVFDDGTGAALYAAGDFTVAGGVPAENVARWDGRAWSALGSGTDAGVSCLEVFDDGTGPALYAGGSFEKAGGVTVNKVARWDGTSWSPVGFGFDFGVEAFAVHDDGTGPALYAGGSFHTADAKPARRIARWDGATWNAVGNGVSSTVLALESYDAGSGPELYAAGAFTFLTGSPGIPSTPCDRVARWDGTAWHCAGAGVGAQARALATFDDGSGPALFAAGFFETAGGAPASRIARWDGASWSALGPGVSDVVYDLAIHDGGSGLGPALIVAGGFPVGPGGDAYLARYGCPAIAALDGCFANPAQLAALADAFVIGTTVGVQLDSGVPAGLALLMLGADGTDAAGCGALTPPLGEILLAPAPKPRLIGSAPLAGGAHAFALPVPAAPGMVGLHAALQGAAIGTDFAVELSNALGVTVTSGS